MKITSVTGPGQVQDLSTPEHIRTAKMTAAFQAKTQPQQEHPVADPNKISAEEVSAIKAPSKSPLAAQTLENRDTPATESAAEETPEAKDPEAERKFAQIARQEKALRAKIHQANLQLKQREAALATREAALVAPAAPDLSQYIPRSRLQQDALSVLEEEGVNWDELTNQAVNRQPTDPRVMSTIQKLEAKIAQLEQDGKTSAVAQQDREKASYAAAIKQIGSDVKNLINSDPAFETVKAMNAAKDVVDLIEKTYAKDGTILDVEEAAKEVEDYLVEEGMKITQLQSIKRRMAAANASRSPAEEKQQSNVAQKQPMKTLTNASSSVQKVSARDRAIARGNGFTGEF